MKRTGDSSIRLTAEQLADFSEYRDWLHAQAKARPRAYPPQLNVPQLSIAAALAYLLARDVEHRARGQRAKKPSPTHVVDAASDR